MAVYSSYKSLALIVLLASLSKSSDAFAPANVVNNKNMANRVQPSLFNIQLHAFTPPTMIIGPMIRKMREKDAEKNRPLASDEEKENEAPGLKVGTGVWKWPPVWPYAKDFFLRPQEEEAIAVNPMASAMMGMGGANPMLNTADMAANAEESKLDTVEFWSTGKAQVTTNMDEEAEDALRNHYSFYLRDGMSVLEFGAAEKSYLPDNLKLARLVGVGLNQELMNTNSALTDSFVADLDKIEDDLGVDSDELRNLGENTFDVILIANTIEFLTHPREVFKSAWRLLKPGGVMMVSFSAKDAMKEKFGDAQTKMWRGYNDDQHMWMAGSFFQFSAGEGWEGLKGFDISPVSAKDTNDKGFLSRFTQQGKDNNIFVCQATKAAKVESIDDSNPEKSFTSLMWMTPTMENRDKILVAPRLAGVYKYFDGEPERQLKIQEAVECLPQVYESLIKMDQFAFPFDLQARLAVDLVSDPNFNANEEQLMALKMGLGLKKPSEEFWVQVGQLTGNMEAEDKVNLLAYMVPRFGSDDPGQKEALQTFITGLKPTIAVVKSKTSMDDADAQLVATELLASEILTPGRSTREEFASWVGAMTEEELIECASTRKSIREKSKAQLKELQEYREAEKAREEEEKKKFKEQIKSAREERTMVFNEETGKIEEKK